MSKFEPKSCAVCGKIFQPSRVNHLYCCPECSEIARRERSMIYNRNENAKRREIRAQEKELRKPVLKPSTMPDILVIMKKADEMDLSYGEYVALYGD